MFSRTYSRLISVVNLMNLLLVSVIVRAMAARSYRCSATRSVVYCVPEDCCIALQRPLMRLRGVRRGDAGQAGWELDVGLTVGCRGLRQRAHVFEHLGPVLGIILDAFFDALVAPSFRVGTDHVPISLIPEPPHHCLAGIR